MERRLWWADTEAGVWREGMGPPEGEGGEDLGQTFPMTPGEVEEVRASGQHVIMLTGLPQKGGRR